jgi:Putative polyhydroxyalkanoic acid system protein (PHA_gran_rgn)
MPKVVLTVPHELGQAGAQTRVVGLITDVLAKYGSQLSDVHQEWNGNTCNLGWKSMGMGMTAVLVVNDADVSVDGTMPMAFMAFKGKMEGIVRDRLTAALAP